MSSSNFRDWRRAASATALLVPFFACLACGSDEAVENGGHDPDAFPTLLAPHEPTCAGLGERLRACGVLTEGPYGCHDLDSEANRCELECLTIASCRVLWDAHCGIFPGVLDNCLTACHSLVCGSGESLPASWRCDAEADCADGSDEVDCPPGFECGSGELMPERARCNWDEDCVDGSDEVGCPGFECGSGELVPADFQCDGAPDCMDGSDEVDCPHLTCAYSGQTLPADWACDQIQDCLDGSDELGCAELVCR